MAADSNETVFTRSKAKKTLGCVDYIESAEFPHGILPTAKHVVQNMLYLFRPKRAGKVQRSKDSAAQILAEIVQEHWLFCNIYTIHTRHIKKHILKIYGDFTNLIQTRKQRQNDAYRSRVEAFNLQAEKLFDIFCDDSGVRKKLEQRHGVKMGDMEWQFLEDQRTERKMYCEDVVDRMWEKAMERRRKDIQSLENMREQAEKEKTMCMPAAEFEESEVSQDESQEDISTNETLSGNSSCDDIARKGLSKKRRMSMSTSKKSYIEDDLPLKYRHIRESVRKVRHEFYEAVDKLKSCYHMSETQAVAAVVIVGNQLFGRQWKFHQDSDVIDLDTLPESCSIRLAGKSLEALALDEIVKEIMKSDEDVVVTYSDDGSKKQGAGSFSVQGITVNGKYRSLPTMSIASESRKNLADLKVAVLSILEAASSVPSKVLFEKIDFVITDQTILKLMSLFQKV